MLTGMNIGGFKAFGATQRVPIRPLTLIYGANSAGKSSILHALALAHHALETGELDAYRTKIGGESIDLGGFKQYSRLNPNPIDTSTRWAFDFSPEGHETLARSTLNSIKKISIEVGLGSHFEEPTPHIAGFSISFDDKIFMSLGAWSESVRPAGRLRLVELNQEHPVYKEIVAKAVAVLSANSEVSTKEQFATSLAEIDLTTRMTGRVTGIFPKFLDPSTDRTLQTGPERLLETTPESREHSYFRRYLSSFVNQVVELAEKNIRKLQYLGPVRSIPPRHLTFAGHHDANWRAGGGQAWDVVRQEAHVRKRVNEWLGASHLKTPYRLEVRNFVATDTINDAIGDRLDNLGDVVVDLVQAVQGKADADEELLEDGERLLKELGSDSALRDILRAMEKDYPEVARVHELTLRDLRSGTALSHRDVGVGISQILPVLVSAYASQEKLIAIEQPELHLHPALQSELGDVFIESALGENRNAFLLETHSEHLILRILRRIRETTDGELPEGVTPVRPEDVAVLYVQPSEKGGSKVIHIPVTPDGDFEQRWPEGFFAERAKELF